MGWNKMKIDIKDRKFVTKIGEIPRIAKEIAKDKHVKAIYLFGSYATGKIHILSDIDICIITDSYEDVDYPSTDNLDVSYFHLLPLTAQFRVFSEGRPLIVNDKNYVDKLKIRTINNYIDFKPFLNRFIMEKFKCTI